MLKEIVVFFIVSFIYAGCALGFIYFAKPKVIYIVNGVIIGGEYIFELVLASAVISFILVKVCMKLVNLKQKLTKKDMICKLKVINNEKYVNLNALLDTGNLLTDPITKEPVVIIELEKIRQIIPEKQINKIEYMLGGDVILESSTYDTRIRAIPYVSVGNKSGLMVAFCFDRFKNIRKGQN